uniref:Uncharacterized protein n=1 Tax=Meloidogyne incognita TaxID=6306 RepID=A0A914M0F9_MELIC
MFMYSFKFFPIKRIVNFAKNKQKEYILLLNNQTFMLPKLSRRENLNRLRLFKNCTLVYFILYFKYV